MVWGKKRGGSTVGAWVGTLIGLLSAVKPLGDNQISPKIGIILNSASPYTCASHTGRASLFSSSPHVGYPTVESEQVALELGLVVEGGAARQRR